MQTNKRSNISTPPTRSSRHAYNYWPVPSSSPVFISGKVPIGRACKPGPYKAADVGLHPASSERLITTRIADMLAMAGRVVVLMLSDIRPRFRR